MFRIRLRPRLEYLALVIFLSLSFVLPIAAQDQYTPPPPPPPPPPQGATPYGPPPPPTQPPPPQVLDELVARIALYPDPLLAQILPASTYPDQIQQAAEWANQHSYLTGDQLADAIRADNLQWDPSVLALLPFPAVLNMMAQDPGWTGQLGNAVLADRGSVMDAIQRRRQQAYQYGYLRSGPYDSVDNNGGYVEILPVNPAYIYVPAYDPLVVFAPPRPGFAVGFGIRFGPGIVIGAGFAPWGWAHPYFGWREHNFYFDYTPWVRGWANRGYYVHPYAHPWAHGPGPRVERHERHR